MKTAYGYVTWDSVPLDDNCVLAGLSGFENGWELTGGISLIDRWEDDARFQMDPEFPTNTVLTDCLININSVIVGSERFKALLEGRGVEKLEFLPVAIIDHKGNPVKNPYWIVHPVEPVHCMDKEASKIKWSSLDADVAMKIRSLVIDEDAIPADRELFRVAQTDSVILVSKALAKEITDAGISGVSWRTIEEFKG